MELFQLRSTPDKVRQAACHRRLQPRAHPSGLPQLVNLDGLRQPLHGDRPQRRDLHVALDQAQRVGGQQGRAGTGELFHARGQMRRLPHRRVVHVQVAPMDRTTTSPELRPMRICTSRPCCRRNASAYRPTASCMASAA